MLNDNPLNVLMENELGMAELYSLFADMFPDHADFWSRLAIEERAHAEVLRMLQEKIGGQPPEIPKRLFTLEAVRTSIEFVHKHIQKVRTCACSHLQALAFAADCERSVIEKEFFAVFDSDTAEIRDEFRALREHTLDHRKRIEEELAAARAKQS